MHQNMREKRYTWTELDTELLIFKYENITTHSELILLFPNRTLRAITKKAQSLGLIFNKCNKTIWSEKEIQVLKNNYENSTPDQLKNLLPNKKYKSILGKANSFGLSKSAAIISLNSALNNTKYKTGTHLSADHKEKLSKHFKGRIISDETKRKMSETASKRIMTGSAFNNYFMIGNIKCQGGSEKKYVEKLIKENKILPVKPTYWIKTPFGRRLLDFEYPDKFIEIKSK